MTRKEFKEHDWKIGETLYRIRYNTYKHFEIPWKIEKVKVSMPSGEWINLDVKHAPFAIFSKSTDLRDYFFDYKSTKQAFGERKEEFKKVVNVLYADALLQEGILPDNPKEFSDYITKLILK